MSQCQIKLRAVKIQCLRITRLFDTPGRVSEATVALDRPEMSLLQGGNSRGPYIDFLTMSTKQDCWASKVSETVGALAD